MFVILISILTVICGVNAYEILYENKFLMNNEKWQITGNKIIEPAAHQSYNIEKEMSHYIMFKDTLINVDDKNPNDKSLWYFESPTIIINNVPRPGTRESINFNPKYPSAMSFTMTSFVGDFNELNERLLESIPDKLKAHIKDYNQLWDVMMGYKHYWYIKKHRLETGNKSPYSIHGMLGIL